MVLFLASVYKLGRLTSHLDQAHRFELIYRIFFLYIHGAISGID